MTKLVKNNEEEQQKLRLQRKKRNIAIGVVAVVICLCVVIGMMVAGDSGKKGVEDAQTGKTTETAKGFETSEGTESNGTESNGAENNGLDASLTYYADIEIQDYGTITIQLNQEAAPVSAANFVELAESGFFTHLRCEDSTIEGTLNQLEQHFLLD